jgi:glycosyltransferase involved in cell wall biosynthesis
MPRTPGLPPGFSLVAELRPIDVPTLRALFEAASVVVLPYVEASQSGVIPVAYSFAKPVVATAVGGLTEVVIDSQTGRLVPPNDPHALAEALSELLLRPDIRNRMKTGIEAFTKRELSWQVNAERLMNIYLETVRSSAA